MIREDLTQLPAYIPGKTVPNALKLASNETSEAPLPAAIEAIESAAHGLNRYPYMGHSPLHDAIAEFHGVSADQVAVGCGSSSLLQQLILATCHDGDEVIYAWRSFEAYPILTRVAGAVPVQVPLTEDLRHDLPAMAQAVTDRTRLVMICNPNNPTGTIVSQAEIEDFLASIPSSVTVCIDEAYIDYVEPELRIDSLGLVNRYPNLCIARTFSKCYGLAGARVGYMIGSTELITAINKTCIPFSVNTLAHDAAIACLNAQDEKESRVAVTSKQREQLSQFLRDDFKNSTKWHLEDKDLPTSHTNFVWLNLGSQAEDFAQQLTDAGVIARCFVNDGVRITVTDEKETDILIEALRKIK